MIHLLVWSMNSVSVNNFCFKTRWLHRNCKAFHRNRTYGSTWYINNRSIFRHYNRIMILIFYAIKKSKVLFWPDVRLQLHGFISFIPFFGCVWPVARSALGRWFDPLPWPIKPSIPIGSVNWYQRSLRGWTADLIHRVPIQLTVEGTYAFSASANLRWSRMLGASHKRDLLTPTSIIYPLYLCHHFGRRFEAFEWSPFWALGSMYDTTF